MTYNTALFDKEGLMLEDIRKKRNSIFIMAVFAAIIIVFIFWGMNPGSKDSDRALVATVDGSPISVKDYANLYKREVEYFKKTFKDRWTDEAARKMDLKQRTLDILINRALVINAANGEGIKVSEAEVQDAIKSIPAFSTNNVFDKDLYFKVLSANRVKPADFEKSIEQDLMTSKMRDKVIKDISVTDNDAKQAYARDNRKINLDFIAIDGERFKKSINVTDAEAKEYLKNNGSAFMAPVRIKAFYARVNPLDITRKVKLGETEIKEFYEKNLKDFELPEMVKAKHILIRPDASAKDREKAKREARIKAEEVLKKIKSGGNFSQLASVYSHDPGSKKQGGELGWFQRGVMVKSFENAAFSLKKGEVSGVVETDFGYHIIMISDKKDAGIMPLNDAETLIKKSLGAQKARKMAKDMADSLSKSFREAKTPDELRKAAAHQKDFKALATDFFAEDDRKSELAGDEILRGSVFQLRAGEVSGPIDAPQGIYVVKVLDRQEAHVPDYNEISKKVKEKLVSAKAEEAAGKNARELLKKAAGDTDINAIAKRENYKVLETGYFSKAEGFIPKLGIYAGDKAKFFELTSSSPYYAEVLPFKDKFYIFKLKSVKEADESGFEEKKADIKSRLLAERQEDALTKWLKELRSKAKIKVYEDKL